MLPSGESPRGPEGGNRRLDSAGFLFHHAHTKEGYRTSKGCRFCAKGLAGITTTIEIRDPLVPTDEVDESSGVDQSGPTTPTPNSDRRSWWE